jgi:hypothetical protein
VPDPVVVRVNRPYRSVEEYLDAEAGTIDARGMLLIDAPFLPRNTLVRFVVSIATGEQLIRAEGVARDHVAASPSAPGGLRVWFKRFGVATKEIIDRAVATRARGGWTGSASGPQSTTDLPRVAPNELPSSPTASSPAASPGAARVQSGEPPRALAARATEPLTPPANRSQLLEQLRVRARAMNAEQLLAAVRR